MPGKPGKQQGLFDDGSLIGFLQSTLEAMEAAAGGQLSEERAKLQELQMALGGLTMSPPKPAEADELALASQLDKLEQQLAAVERTIATADDGTKQLLTHSTTVWAGAGAQQQGSSGPSIAASPEPAAPNGAGAGTSQDPCDHANATTAANTGSDTSAVLQAVSSGLLPVAEAAEEGDESDG